MIKVLVVDDSAIVRQVLERELGRAEGLEIVGSAPDPYVARDMIVDLRPDVVLLDIEMPRMDGLTFLKKLVQYYPLPVIIVSSLTKEGADLAVDAVNTGAVDVVSKPGSSFSVSELVPSLVDKIKAASRVNIHSYLQRPAKQEQRITTELARRKITNKVIAIGASTGGTQAIDSLLQQLPGHVPGILIVQHMPENFTASFAERLNERSALEVREARNNDSVVPGVALIAPGNYHMILRRSGARFYVSVKQGPMICRQRPSVDVLFKSVAQNAGKNAAGALLTGMGKDGAEGLLQMLQAEARTIAQDEKSSLVFGMPQEAIKMGGAESVLSLSAIPGALVEWANSQGT
jgi:two-component system chemotaxis response regulator CheB